MPTQMGTVEHPLNPVKTIIMKKGGTILAWHGNSTVGSPDRKAGLAISINGGSTIHVRDGENIAVPDVPADANISLQAWYDTPDQPPNRYACSFRTNEPR